MIRPDELLVIRRMSDHYQPSCPIHLSMSSCEALFQEGGIAPDQQAVGCLGDILENFALKILAEVRGTEANRDEVETALRRLM